MYSTAYNLWTFTWFVHFELKIFIPRDSFNSSLYILFSMSLSPSVSYKCVARILGLSKYNPSSVSYKLRLSIFTTYLALRPNLNNLNRVAEPPKTCSNWAPAQISKHDFKWTNHFWTASHISATAQIL